MSLSVALTKGRLEKSVTAMLEECGYGVDKLKDKGRALVIEDTKKDIRYFLAKPNDVITYVEHGVADIGIVGKDTLMEGGKDYYELLDLKTGVCKFILAGLPGNNPLQKVGHITIGTKYPNVASEYFHRHNLDPEIIKIDGSVELSPLLGLCDGIVDIMETGTTLKENGLVVLEEICPLSARMIVNQVSMQMESERIQDIIHRLKEQL